MVRPNRNFAAAAAALALLTAFPGCLFQGEGGGESSLTAATLAETGLAGEYDLIFFRLEYSDGTVYDSTLKLSGSMTVGEDSAYVQQVRINGMDYPTEGRILILRARRDDRAAGEMAVSMEGTSGVSQGSFAIRGDTLAWTIEKKPSEDGRIVGFIESTRYLRRPIE